MSYSLNIYVNYILNETVDDKDLPCMSGWNNNAYCKEYVRSGGTLFDLLIYENRTLILYFKKLF